MLCSILKKRWNSSVLRMSVDGKSHLFAVLRRVAGATGCGRIASLLRTHRSQVFSDRVHTQSTIADYPISRLHSRRIECGAGASDNHAVAVVDLMLDDLRGETGERSVALAEFPIHIIHFDALVSDGAALAL